MTRRRQRERGASAVEFALVLPVLLLVIGGIIDFGRMFYAQNVVGNAAREGARMISLGYPITTAGGTPDATSRINQAMINYQGSSYTTKVYQVSAAGTKTEIASSSWTGTTPCSGVPEGTATEVQITVEGFKYIVLGPASQLVGGSALLPAKPNGAAQMRCGG